MKWILDNNLNWAAEISIESNALGGWYLYVFYPWMIERNPYDSYNFKTDTAAKSYFAKNWKNKNGVKPKWKKLTQHP